MAISLDVLLENHFGKSPHKEMGGNFCFANKSYEQFRNNLHFENNKQKNVQTIYPLQVLMLRNVSFL